MVITISLLCAALAFWAFQAPTAVKPKRSSKQDTGQRTWQDAAAEFLEEDAKAKDEQAKHPSNVKVTLLESLRLKKLEALKQKEFLEQQYVKQQSEKRATVLELQKTQEQEAHKDTSELAEHRANAEAKLKVWWEAKQRAKAEAELKAKTEAEQRARALVRKAKAEQMAIIAADWEARVEAARAKVEREQKARAEAEQRAKAEQNSKAEAAESLKQQLTQINWHDQQALDVCEEGTPYCAALQARFLSVPHHSCFDVIKGLSCKQNDDIWSQLEQGIKQLDTPQQLLQYIFSYGNMHKAKLIEAYSALAQTDNLQLSGQKIEVYDYGCGQGIATVILLDYLKAEHNFNCSLAQVVLIEPSALALKRAALHVKQSLASVKLSAPVAAYQLELDSIEPQHLKSCEGTVKFHLFSNILDVQGINMTALQSKLLASLTGVNYFICVSPRIWKNGVHERNQRLHNFFLHFKKNCNATLIADRDTDVLCVRNKPHARFERVFRVNAAESKLVTSNLQEVDEEEDLSGLFF